MKTARRKIIEINEGLCDGCGLCVPDCAEGALEIVDGKARVVADRYCDGLGACIGACPTGALKIIEREAEEFDEAAVEELLRSRREGQEKALAGLRNFQAHIPCQAANFPRMSRDAGEDETALRQWPVQIRLVPPDAPFLKDADLLVVADCVPVAYRRFHRDFLAGRAVMMGCPKFDDTEGYVDKFARILEKAEPRRLKIVMMEVPCCAGLRRVISEAMRRAGHRVPVSEAVIGVRGAVISQGEWSHGNQE